jgi:hypothetical protein
MVVVTASGEVRDEDARAQTAETFHLLKRHHATSVLVDYSEAVSEVSLARLYGLAEYSAELGMSWDTRVAVALPRTKYRLESYQFFELASKIAGYNVRLFEDKEAAEHWLATNGPIQPQGAPPVHA